MSQPTLTVDPSDPMQPWTPQMQATALELEHVQRQLAQAQAQDTKARFAAEVAAAAAAQQKQHEEHQQQMIHAAAAAAAAAAQMHQPASLMAAQYQHLNPMGGAPTSDALSPNMAGPAAAYISGVSPTLSQASSFNGSLSPSLNPNLGFFPFSPQNPHQPGFMSGSPNLGLDILQSLESQQPTNRTVYVGACSFHTLSPSTLLA